MPSPDSAITEQGYFWWADEKIPANCFAPKNHVTGSLTISADGTSRLELDGSLRQDRSPFGVLTGGPPRSIAGRLKRSRRHILLLDASPNGGEMRSNDFSFERYISHACLVGDRVRPISGASPTFLTISISLDGFEQWLRLQRLALKQTHRRLSVSWKSTREIRFQTDFGKVKIKLFPTLTQNDYLPTYEVALREHAELSISPQNPISAQDASTIFHRLQDLMILLTDSSHAFPWPMVRIFRQRSTHTFYFPRKISSEEAPKYYETPTNFPLLRTTFGNILSNWKNQLDNLGPGVYSYIATRRDITLLVESRFSMLAQGIEAFHRKKYGDPPPSPALKEKIDRILNQVSGKDDKRWLAYQLNTAPSLEQRVAEVLCNLPLSLDAVRVQKFSSEFASLRNDLAHYGGERSGKTSVEYTRKLNAFSEAISSLYHVLLLREIGVEDEVLKKWLLNAPKSGRIQFWLAEVGLILKKAPSKDEPGTYSI
jgi:hypothetical protein